MANRKRRRERDKPRRGSWPRPPADRPTLPDPRVMEGVLRQVVSGLQGEKPGDNPAQDKALELLEQAYRTEDVEKQNRLAREAIAAWPDCADAYLILAENAAGFKQSLVLHEQAFAAGERAVGSMAFQREVGHFWGLLETRPYMRARQALAFALWANGRREEAVRHLQEMLRLNPNDNQGVRYPLAGWLLFLDRDDDLEKLLAQFADEGSAAWAYTLALLAFRRHGDTLENRRLLKAARKANKHIPPYLLGRKFPPAQQVDYYSPGDENEAHDYVHSFLAGWRSTPGAVAWLRANVKSKSAAEARQTKGPLGFIKTWLKDRLPQQDDVWQADFRQTPNWIVIAGEKVRPWMVFVTSRSDDFILAHDLADEQPTPAFLWDVLVRAMQHPAMGDPHRPAELQVVANTRWESLRSHLAQVGVELVVAEELDQLQEVLASMAEQIAGKREPGLLDAPGVTPRQVAGFFDAAAYFFQQAPWKKIAYESAIKVECDKFESSPWYAVLMGQTGLATGLALYDDIKVLNRLWGGDFSDRDNARLTVATSVMFGEEWDIPVADLEAARRHSWKVARPDAYPSVFHKERGLSSRPPLVWELELMEACLRAIPDFVNRCSQEDTAREETTVPTALGELKLGLSWVVDVDG